MNQLKMNPLTAQVAQKSNEQISAKSIHLDRTKKKKRQCEQGLPWQKDSVGFLIREN